MLLVTFGKRIPKRPYYPKSFGASYRLCMKRVLLESSPALAGFFVSRLFSLHSTDGIRMSKRKHIEKIDERVDR